MAKVGVAVLAGILVGAVLASFTSRGTSQPGGVVQQPSPQRPQQLRSAQFYDANEVDVIEEAEEEGAFAARGQTDDDKLSRRRRRAGGAARKRKSTRAAQPEQRDAAGAAGPLDVDRGSDPDQSEATSDAPRAAAPARNAEPLAYDPQCPKFRPTKPREVSRLLNFVDRG
jgi:hypothetical protein